MQLLPLSTLPKDNTVYHVDCVGHLRPNPYCIFNPILDVRLSPIEDKYIFSATEAVSRQFDRRKQKAFQISAGEMYAIHSGCVLKNGKIISTPNQPNFHENIIVTENSIRSIFASKLDNLPIIGNSKYIIPNNRWGLGALGMSQLIAIERNDDPYSILIPAIELFRFYHCSSSRLNQFLISGQVKYFDHYIDTEKGKTFFDSTTKTLHLSLKKAFPKEDALIVGRWFCDKRAHDAAMGPWNQRMKLIHHPNADYIPLGSTFPFYGEASIQGIGIKLPTPDHIKTQRVLLVSLTYCSHELPFNHLILKHTQYENGETTEANEDDEPEKIRKKRRRRTPPDSIDSNAESDPFANPCGFWDTEHIRIPSSRFPSIKITHEKHYLESSGTEYSVPNEDGSASGQTTSMTSATGSTAVAVNIVPLENIDEQPENDENETSVEANFAGFIEICNELERRIKVFSVSSISIFEKLKISNHSISEFPDSVSGFGQSWIRMGKGAESSNRRFMLKQIRSRFGYHYLLHIERKLNSSGQVNSFSDHFAVYIFSSDSTEEVTHAKLDALLRDLSEAGFRHYKAIFNNSRFLVSTKRHTTTADKMATSILKKLSVQTLPEAKI